MKKEYMLFLGEYVDGRPFGRVVARCRDLEIIKLIYNDELKKLNRKKRRRKKYAKYFLDIYERTTSEWLNMDNDNIFDFDLI